jgi:hypothetical protein
MCGSTAERVFCIAVVVTTLGAAACTRRNLGYEVEPGVTDLSTEKGPRYDLAGVDTGAEDLAQAAIDLAAAVDLATPDLPASGSCDDRFGALPGYLLCEETATTCRFSVGNEVQKFNCAAACADGASVCLSEWEVNGVSCDVGTNPLLSCSTQHHEVVCVCSR